MFDLISQSMLFLLQSLKAIVGNYGWAIIVLTLIVRGVLWPVSQSQMKSMKVMQDLQPKMKLLQERHKGDPQKLQTEMMKLYKDHKFNPLSGCLPMLIQLPLFLGLYWAISNPMFMPDQDPMFLNFVHLKHSGIMSHAGSSQDGKMSLSANGGDFLWVGKDGFQPGPKMTIVLNNGTQLTKNVSNRAIDILPKDPQPGVPLTITTSYKALDLQGYEGLVKSIQMDIVNRGTREIEKIQFAPTKAEVFTTTLPTEAAKTILHVDVLILFAIFALTSIISQRAMQSQSVASGSPQQQQMMKMMPIMFTAFFVFVPIPAGVLLYMDTNSLFQLFQTWAFQKGIFSGGSGTALTPPSERIVDIKAD